MPTRRDAAEEFQDVLSARKVAARYAMEHPSDEARKDYLKDHPGADPKNHSVKKDQGSSSGAPLVVNPLLSQMSSMVKKIDGIDAGASKQELKKHVNEISQLGQRVERQLEKLEGKVEDSKLNRAIEHAQSLSLYADDLMAAAGNSAKVDKLLGNVQGELRSAMKLLS